MSDRPDRPERWSTSERDEALALAAVHGAEEASRRTRIPAGTIRWWMHALRHAFEGEQAGELVDIDVDNASGDDGQPADLLEAAELWQRRAHRAAERMDQLVQAGKAQDARHLATVAGIATDKALMLARAAQVQAEHQAVIDEKTGHTLAAVLRGVLAELGLPMDVQGQVPALVRKHIGFVSGHRLPTVFIAGDAAERAARIREMRDELAARREASEELAELEQESAAVADVEPCLVIDRCPNTEEPAFDIDRCQNDGEPVDADDVLSIDRTQDDDGLVDSPARGHRSMPAPSEERRGRPRPPAVTRQFIYRPPGTDDPTRGDAA